MDMPLKTTFQAIWAIGPKIGTLKMSQGHFMAKTLLLHPNSCRVNQQTQLSIDRKWR
jgi:hypothetical protein